MESKTVFKTTVVILLTLFAAYILFLGAEIIITLLIAIIIASAVRPAVNGLKRIKIPESVAIVIVYGTMALVIITILFVLIPPMFNQFAIYVEQDWRLASRIITANQIAENYISDVISEDVSLASSEQIREAVTVTVSEFRTILPNLIQNIGTIIANAVLIFVMGTYWLTSHASAKRFILKLTTPRYRDETRVIINDIEQTLGGFVRSAVIISVIVAMLNFVPMYILGVPNAFTMAFIIGTMTIIPMVGGLIGGGIATLLTLITDPPLAIVVLITFLVVSQIENYFLQPRIMSDGVGMNPLLVIVYTSIGFVLSGVIGALIAIPVMGAFHILLEHLVIEPYRAQMKDDTSPEDLIVEIEPDDEVTIKKVYKEDEDA